MSLSKRLRFEILTRDDHTCRYCGGRAPDVALTVDHVLPISLGGSDEPSNLVAACKDCNAGKSSVKPGSPMLEEVARDAERWAEAIKYLSGEHSHRLEKLDEILDLFDAAWCDWTNNYTKQPLERSGDWRRTVETWLKRGITPRILAHHIPTAMNAPKVAQNEVWRYYCGIIWKTVTQLDAEAAALLVAEEAVDEFEELDSLKAT